jgi:SAM-dependent methyltransferase
VQYDQDYENSLDYSPCFQDYAQALAKGLIDRYDLRDKQIIEIGCGKGEFLNLLCEFGKNHGIGFDPSYVPGRIDGTAKQRITFIRDFYSRRYASYAADFICCRHVLEHIQFPRHFVTALRHIIGDRLGTIVFFEVPNIMFSLRHSGIWDLIYEHCSYFSSASLARVFSACGFEVRECAEAFDGQFLCIEAFPATGSANSEQDFCNDVKKMAIEVSSFAEKYHRQVAHWQRMLEKSQAAGKRVIVWGGGSKGVTFLNTLQRHSQIEYVVDINPRKQGEYIAGTGQRIVPPKYLVEYQPEVILVMNPIYLEEISRDVRNLNLSSQVVAVS